MSLFDTDKSDQLLALAFNKPSEKRAEQILARRLCKVLGIDYASLDKNVQGKNALVAQVVERFIETSPASISAVKRLLPNPTILANDIRKTRPKTAYEMGAVLRGMAY